MKLKELDELLKKVEELSDFAHRIKLLTNLEPKEFLCQLIKYGLANEPQKVKVPECVAEYIIWCHSEGLTMWKVFKNICVMPEKVWKWLKDEEHQAIFSKAYTDGYEVEEEPKWIVKYIPPFVDEFRYYSMDDEIFDITESSWTSDKEDAYLFTEKEKAEAVATLVEGSVDEI